MSEEEILKNFVGILEDHFPDANTFLARDVELDKFVYVNDEELDKKDEHYEDEEIECNDDVVKTAIQELERDTTIIPISAVDASSARLGETNRGVISAVRLAVWKQEPDSKPTLCQYGPYLAHITPDNIDFIYNYFRCEVFGMKKGKPPRIMKMTDRLRNFFERLGQRRASSIISNGITLWDGSLRGATVDTPLDLLRDSVEKAHLNHNTVIGISKYSTLRTASGEKLLDMFGGQARSCIIDVNDKVSKKLIDQIVGRVHVVRFTPDGFSFRVDVSPCSDTICTDALKLLKGNCLFHNGYPDPLRQVHVHAYFTPNELLSLQNLAIEKYQMKVLRSFDVKRHLLAPYG